MKKEKIVIISTIGSESPEKATLPFVFATAAQSMDVEISVFLQSNAVVLAKQGETEKILEIIKKGLERSINCSSDPLCWESEGQGIFDLNLSACFSCSLVAETACEEMNLGLDRRVLVDEDFGYFRSIQT